MPTNQVLHERTGLSLACIREWRRRLEEHGWLGLVGGGRSAGYAESGANEAQVFVLCIPTWWVEKRATARRNRSRAAFYGAVDKKWHPHTLKSEYMKTTRVGDTPQDGPATAGLPICAPNGAWAMVGGKLSQLKQAAYRFGADHGAPDVADEWVADAHRASEAPEKPRGAGSRFNDDLHLAAQWLQANVEALAEVTLGWIMDAIKAKIRYCGWNVSDILDGIEFDPATNQRWRGGSLDIAKYPARVMRHRLDAWGTKTPAGRLKGNNFFSPQNQ